MINSLNMNNNEWLLAGYIQYILATTIDEENSYATTPIDFRYKQFVDDDGNRSPLPGMLSSGQAITIETSSDLDFKPEDKIRFYEDNGNYSEYTISNVSKLLQLSNTSASFQFAGITDKYKRTIITL